MASCSACHDLLMAHPREPERDPNSNITTEPSLSASLDEIADSMLSNQCRSCGALYIAISLFQPDLCNFNIPIQSNAAAMDGYHAAMRIGSTLSVSSMPNTQNHALSSGIFVKGGRRQGCGLCVCLLFHNGPTDTLGTLFEFDIFTQSGMCCSFRRLGCQGLRAC